MSFVHEEGKLRFTFDEGWKILKWDAHGAYQEGLQRFSGTKAVDFFGLYNGAPYFLEVKDFRQHRIENKDRLRTDGLAKEVACKVRDTLAGMSWSCGREPLVRRELSEFLKPLINRVEKVPVVLWLEEDRPPSPAFASAIGEAIRQELLWLNPKVRVTSRKLAPIPGLTVMSLP
jgi:hypothetical protein